MKTKTLLLLAIMGSVGCLFAQDIDAPSFWLSRSEMAPTESIQSKSASPSHTEEDVSLINFHSVLELDGLRDRFEVDFDPEVPRELSIFCVYEPIDGENRLIWTAQGCQERAMYQSTQRVLGPSGVQNSLENEAPSPTLVKVVQYWGTPVESKTSEGKIVVGAPLAEQSEVLPFRGKLAEMLIFSEPLSTTEQIQYETFLAIKYGIHLEETNYVDSKENVLWKRAENPGYNHRITGIGRDDAFGLDQKQSTSSAAPGLVTIAGGELETKNSHNEFEMADGDFLLWGDDNGKLTWEEHFSEELDRLGRTWRVRPAGNFTGTTELHLGLPATEFTGLPVLIVDRTGTGTWAPEAVDYYFAESASDSTAAFKNIDWDPDGSGMDCFSFVSSEKLHLFGQVQAWPNCNDADGGAIIAQATGGNPPYTFNVTSGAGDKMASWEGTESQLTRGLETGIYQWEVTDQAGNQVTQEMDLQAPGWQTFDLDLARQTAGEGKTVIDLADQIPPEGDYQFAWTAPDGATTDGPRLEMEAPGTYELEIFHPNGCQSKHAFGHAFDALLTFEVYPSPVSRNQTPIIKVGFGQVTPIHLEITDATGRVLHEWEGTDQADYTFEQKLFDAGVYFVRLYFDEQELIKKIVVSDQ